MKRKDKKGRTVLQIIHAGGSHRHFRYLLNGSHIHARLSRVLPTSQLQLLSFGTCVNEALHFQLKSSQEVIVQQHVEVLELHLSAFALAKLLAHNAAAYFPTIAQRRESEVLSLLQGRITAGVLPVLSQEEASVIRNREDLRKPVHELDASKAQRRQDTAARQQSQWRREERLREEKKAKRQVTNVRAAPMKRTVFTKQKPVGLILEIRVVSGSMAAVRGKGNTTTQRFLLVLSSLILKIEYSFSCGSGARSAERSRGPEHPFFSWRLLLVDVHSTADDKTGARQPLATASS